MKIHHFFRTFRVALVSLDWIRAKDPKIPLGQASLIAKLLENKNYSKDLSLFNLEFDVKKSFYFGDENSFDQFCHSVCDRVLSKNPNLIALGAFVWNEPHIKKIIWLLRKQMNYKQKILLGGPQVTYALRGTLEKYYPGVDFFIRGYAENSLNQLLIFLSSKSSQNLNTITGLHTAGSIDLGLQSAQSNELEILPSPFLGKVLDVNRTFIRWESQRGCPFRCSFCQHRDNYTSRHGLCIKRIQSEIELFCDKKLSKVNDIAVLDPTFNSGKSYLTVLDLFRKNGYQGKLALQTRMEMISLDFMEKIEKLNEQGAKVILECGIQSVINKEMKIIKRLNNLKKIEQISQKLHERSIEFEVSLIFGLPEQNLESFKKSIDFCIQNIKANKIDAWPLMILRGTELDQKKKLFGLKEELISDNFDICLPKERMFLGIPHVTSSDSFSRKEWLEMFKISKKLNSTKHD